MPSPQGTFVGETLESLQELKQIALDRIKYGDRTALSGAGKSSSRNFSMSASDMQREVQYALDRLTGAGTPRRTNFAPHCPGT